MNLYEIKLINGPLDGETTYLTELFKSIKLPTRLDQFHIYVYNRFTIDEIKGKTYYYDYDSTR